MATLLERLVTIYAAEQIRYPNLRAVTLAQWLLESGRGSSRLATEHYNFGGLKWRPEMAAYATPVDYDAHDGRDKYCHFATLESFIRGYWAFLDRAPYSGWEAHAADSADFITYIGRVYTPREGYAAEVLSLAGEAAQMLMRAGAAPAAPPAAAGAVDLGAIVLDPGHGGTTTVGGSSPNNAISHSGVKEKKLTLEFCLILQHLLQTQAADAGERIRVVLTRTTDMNVGIRDRAHFARANDAKLFLCLHFNGMDDETISGVETYYATVDNPNMAADKAFATAMHEALLKGLQSVNPATKDRQVKPETQSGPRRLGVLRDDFLGNPNHGKYCLGAYFEAEFISNPMFDNLFISGPQAVANRTKALTPVAEAIRKQMR